MKFRKFILFFLLVILEIEYVRCSMLKKEQHELKKDLRRMHKLFSIADRWILLELSGEKLGRKIEKKGYHTTAIYGMGELGIRFIEELKLNTSVKVLYGIDRNADRISTYIPVYRLEDIQKQQRPELVVITAYGADEGLKENIRNAVGCDVISIEELING